MLIDINHGGVMERTLIIIKPDGVQRKLVGKMLTRFEDKGLKICALKMIAVDKALAEKHYGEHKGEYFYEPLIEYITSGPVVLLILEGKSVIPVIRKILGNKDPLKAENGTIRADFVSETRYNIIHASDSTENAEREIDIFFRPEEIIDYKLSINPWIYTKETLEG